MRLGRPDLLQQIDNLHTGKLKRNAGLPRYRPKQRASPWLVYGSHKFADRIADANVDLG